MRKRKNSDVGGQGDGDGPGGDTKQRRGGNPTIKVVRVSSVAWLCLGLAIGTLCGGPWLKDIVDVLRGYRWNYLDRCILETPEDTGVGVDFCRVPVDCDMCRSVDKIDEVHVDDLSVEEFEARYAYSSRPLVVRNASLAWAAMDVLNYQWLKNIYLSDPEILEKEGDECSRIQKSEVSVQNV